MRLAGIGLGGYSNAPGGRLLISALARLGVGCAVFGLERPVDLDQHLLLTLGDCVVADDGGNEVGRRCTGRPVVEDAGAYVQRLGRDTQASRDRLEDVSRWLAQAAFDLTQVGIRYTRAFAELAQREPRVAALIANELTEIVQPRVERLSGFGFGHAVPATCLAAISRSSASITPCSSRRADESSVSNSRSRSRLVARSS